MCVGIQLFRDLLAGNDALVPDWEADDAGAGPPALLHGQSRSHFDAYPVRRLHRARQQLVGGSSMRRELLKVDEQRIKAWRRKSSASATSSSAPARHRPPGFSPAVLPGTGRPTGPRPGPSAQPQSRGRLRQVGAHLGGYVAAEHRYANRLDMVGYLAATVAVRCRPCRIWRPYWVLDDLGDRRNKTNYGRVPVG
jgi:hypothetical protein